MRSVPGLSARSSLICNNLKFAREGEDEQLALKDMIVTKFIQYSNILVK